MADQVAVATCVAVNGDSAPFRTFDERVQTPRALNVCDRPLQVVFDSH